MPSYQRLLENNRRWVAERKSKNKDYFKQLSETHEPQYMLIACCDSRVAPLRMIGAHAGEVFIHRNIGNIIQESDPNAMTALEYGIHTLGIEHIIICGHYKCGAVLAASDAKILPGIDPWIQPIRDVISVNKHELTLIKNDDEWHKKIVELHIRTQCKNVLTSPSYQKALALGSAPRIHGWIYDIESGRLIDLNISKKASE